LAAARVFDAALDQRVDFVVLSGDVVDPHRAAPRELLFLVDQFQRLADHNIAVYWSGGLVDSADQWPTYAAWPSNVHRFPCGRAERYRHEIAGAAVCEIIGCSHDVSQPPKPYEFTPSGAELFSIAVAHAAWNAGAMGEIGARYWALGGPHHRSTPLESSCVAHFAGSPQGRCSSELGPHGCTVVSVDQLGRIQLTPIACDVLRWLTPQLSLPATADHVELEQLLHDRTEQLLAESSGVALLVTWQVACQGSLRFALRHGSLGAELISNLRQQFGRRQSPVWTLAIEAELPDQLPAQWFAEETLRGDFLRAVGQCSPEFLSGRETQGAFDHDATVPNQATGPNQAAAPNQATVPNQIDLAAPQPLELTVPENVADWISTDNLPPASDQVLASLGPLHDEPEFRRRLLREVAWLGANLLSPAETPP
jgi:hypothetical protein